MVTEDLLLERLIYALQYIILIRQNDDKYFKKEQTNQQNA